MEHLHHKKNLVLLDSGQVKRFKGGSTSTTITNPTPPAAPTTGESIADWLKYAPEVFAEQQRQAPLEAQLELSLMQQYAQPLGMAYKTAQEAMYPGTSAIQETMANQSLEGMNATKMPDWMAKNYKSDLNANLGTQAGGPIGADYVSRGMQNQLFEQQKYYRDLGLSLAGRQPLAQPTQPQTTNSYASMSPATVMGQQGQNYGSYVAATRPLLSQNQKAGYLWGMF